MLNDENIDTALLTNMTKYWQKVAFVVGSTMMQFDRQERVGLDDLYFAERLSVLAKKGCIEYTGDLNDMRKCEVRLPTN